MWRTLIAIFASTVLALTILAACETDQDDESNGAVDDAISVDDDPAVPDEDRTAADEDEAVEEEDDGDGAARTDDDEEDAAGQSAGEEPGDDVEQVSELTEVTLVDHELEMTDSVEAGIVSFGITNDGEEEHGIAIEPANGAEGDGEILGTMLVAPGENEQLELELEAGEYVVFCPVDDHRETHDMETTLTVE